MSRGCVRLTVWLIAFALFPLGALVLPTHAVAHAIPDGQQVQTERQQTTPTALIALPPGGVIAGDVISMQVTGWDDTTRRGPEEVFLVAWSGGGNNNVPTGVTLAALSFSDTIFQSPQRFETLAAIPYSVPSGLYYVEIWGQTSYACSNLFYVTNTTENASTVLQRQAVLQVPATMLRPNQMLGPFAAALVALMLLAAAIPLAGEIARRLRDVDWP